MTDFLQVSDRFLTGSRRYGKAPADVWKDATLTLAAKVVLVGMGIEAQGKTTIAISHQSLAVVCGMVRPTVSSALKELVKAGQLEAIGKPVKQVQPYRLLHPLFAFGKGGELDVRTVRGKGTGYVMCYRCGTFCKQLPPDKICGACKRQGNIEKTAERVGRRVAIEEIKKAKVVA